MNKRPLLLIGLTTVIAVVALIIGFAFGIGGSDDEASYELVVELRAGENAPTSFGFEPGEALAGVKVNLELSEGGNAPPAEHSGTTGNDGRLTLIVEGGSYYIFVAADTTDPLCVWLGSTEVTVSASPTIVTLHDLAVACQ